MDKPNLTNPSIVQALVTRLHFEEGLSLRDIERRYGWGKTTFTNACRRHGILTRTQREGSAKAARETPKPRGDQHWAFGLTKETSAIHQRHSRRMKAHNPMRDATVVRRVMVKRAGHLRKNPTKPEIIFAGLLDRAGMSYQTQVCVGTYIIDFLLPGRITVELDSSNRAYAKAEAHAIRDEVLLGLGYTVIRYQNDRKVKTATFHGLIEVLKQFFPHQDFPRLEPSPFSRGKRVLLRDQQLRPELCCQFDDRAIADFAHRRVDRTVPTAVGQD